MESSSSRPPGSMRSRFNGVPAAAILTACLILPVSGQPQNLVFQHITTADGLSDGTVTSILQDRHGFMWFGTRDGLNRYDGYRFTVYKSAPFDTTTLSGNYVEDIFEDGSGTIWIATRRGLNRWNPSTDTFTRYMKGEPGSGKLNTNSINVLYEDRRGILWIGTQGGGVNHLDRRSGTFEQFMHDPDDSTSLGHNRVHSIHEGVDGSLWIGTTSGVCRMNPADGSCERYLHVEGNPAGPPAEGGHAVLEIYDDPDFPDRLRLVSHRGLVLFETETGHGELIPLPIDRSEDIFISAGAPDPVQSDIFWLVGGRLEGGLFRIDVRTEEVTVFRHDPDDPFSPSARELRSIFFDGTDIMWIGDGARGRGLNKHDPASGAFTSLARREGGSMGLGHDLVAAVDEDSRGRLWLVTQDPADGSRASIDRVDRVTEESDSFVHDPSSNSSLGPGPYWSLEVGRDGRVWVGSNGGLWALDPETAETRRYVHDPDDPNSLGANVVGRIFEDRRGMLWLGTWGSGLTSFDPRTETFERYSYRADDSTSISHVMVLDMFEDHAGVLWVSARYGGLNRLDGATGTFTHFTHDSSDPNSLSHERILTIYERAREPGVLWLGTDGGGLDRFDTRTEAFTHFTEQDGLPSNYVYSILEDGAGHLWLCTGYGLVRFDPDAETFRTYTLEDGLPTLNFSEAAVRTSRRELAFGSSRGLIMFHSDEVAGNPFPPPVTLTGLLVNYGALRPDEGTPANRPIWETDALHLPHDRNTLSIDFAAMHYRNSSRNRYAYRLDPVDRSYVDTGFQRSVTFSNLRPGSYTFHVRAANSDDVWNDAGTSLRVHIQPPWWRTGWAYALYALLTAGAVVGVDRVRRRQLLRTEREKARIREAQLRADAAQEQAATLRQLDILKSRFFANLSHEFRTPLTLILDPLDRLPDEMTDDRHRRQLRMMQRQAERLLDLIEQLLDLSRLDAGGMTLQARRIDLVTFLRRLVSSYSSRAERDGIALRFSTEQQEVLLFADTDHLEKIFTNLLSNALKFTPTHGKVVMSIRKATDESGEVAVVTVRDTGRGIPADDLPFIFDRFYQADAPTDRSAGGAGIGLALARELVELHGGSIHVESEQGFGTTFTVELRLGTGHLRQEDIVEEQGDVFAAISEMSHRTETDDFHMVRTEGGTAPEDAPVVLVVEDNPDVRSYICEHLSAHYHVEWSPDGTNGFAKARSLIPDLVIADVMMPGMDGYELCHALKTHDKLSHVPVILLTARASEADRIEGLKKGADDYICKPFRMTELLVRVENLIELRRAIRERFSDEVVIRPGDISVPSEEAAFLEKVHEAIENQLGNTNFTVEVLASSVGLSTRQLYRRLKQTTRLSPGGYIRKMRLERAAQLLECRAGPVSQIAHDVGFNDADYFSRLFRQTYGLPPSEYMENMS